MMVSVVVIGRNEGERLKNCLRSVLQMRRDGNELELIYVDSRSTDGSVQAAEALGAQCIALAEGATTAARGRNAGWHAARGEYVMFLDGDTLLESNFVEDALVRFAQPELACVWGHRRESHPEHSLYNRALDLDWISQPGWLEFCGGDALFRRTALEQVGGYDEALIAGEEPEMCRRMVAQGWKIYHIDALMTKHDLAITSFGQYWKRAVRTGHAYSEVAQRFEDTDSPFWSEELARTKSRALTLIVMLTVTVLLAIGLHSLWPLLVWAGLIAVIVLRTMLRARWRSANLWTLFVYAVHSHLQQIPIFWGHLRFRSQQRAGHQSQILEYK